MIARSPALCSFTLVCSCLALCTAACSSDSGSSSNGNGGSIGLSGEVTCRNDARVDAYGANLQKHGQNGVFDFRLVSSDPAPPIKGSNTFVVQVLDRAGAPADASLGVDLFMPDHGHGTTVVPSIEYDPNARSYSVAPMYLFMAGVWRIVFTASATDATSAESDDEAAFYFCIEG